MKKSAVLKNKLGNWLFPVPPLGSAYSPFAVSNKGGRDGIPQVLSCSESKGVAAFLCIDGQRG